MVGIRQLLVWVVLVASSVSQAWANMGPPPQPRQPDTARPAQATTLVVVVDHRQAQTRLIIPKNLAGVPLEFRQEPAVTPGRQGAGDVRSRTVVAGVALSLLLVGGGAVTILVRRSRGRVAIITSVAVLAALGLWASLSLADLPPRPENGRTFNLAGPYSGSTLPTTPPLPVVLGSLVIQPDDQAGRPTLIIGRDLAGAFSQIEAPPNGSAGNGGFGSAPPQ